MASTSESGHAKNTANFQDLIGFVTGYGTIYNPSKSSLQLANLILLKNDADAKLADVVAKNTNYNNAVNDRAIAFTGLKQLATRLVNSLQTTDASKEKVSDAKGFNRKMQGKRATSKQTPVDGNAIAPKTISASQQSLDQLIQHFSGLISVLQSEASYNPNESDLKITSLTDKQTDLVNKNNAVVTAYTTISNSRLFRNKILYDDTTGLIDVAADVKKYVKSVYGSISPEYAQIKSIKFINLKR